VTVVTLPNDWTPRWYQTPVMRYFDEGGRFAVENIHRRAGKDLTALNQTCKMMHRRKGAYWHIFPTAEQGRKAIWEGFTKDGKRIMEQVFPRAIRKSPRDFLPKAEMVVELKCGSIWRLQGSDKMEVVGAGPVGVVFSEFALAKPSTWNLIRPMLRENGGWAWFISTPRGNNHFKELYDSALKANAESKGAKWFVRTLTLLDTKAYDPEETFRQERDSGMPESLIQQEYMCDWTAANVGSFYGSLLQALGLRGGLAEFEHGSDEVFTSWDLGHDDSTAIWFWRLNARRDGVDFIDHYESNGKPMSHYFDVLEERTRTQGYRYKKHWLPHDARAKTLQTGASILEQCMTRWGSSMVAIAPQLSVQDGIQAGRWLLQQETRFHPRCSAEATPEDIDGVDALRSYHRAWDEDRKTFSSAPVHDWASHTADAFRYAACVVKVSELLTRKPEPPKAPVVRGIDSFTLDEAWTSAPTRSGRIG
jgi:hypothetical protein